MKITQLPFYTALDRVKPTLGVKSIQDLHKYFCFRNGTVSTWNGNSGTITKSLLPKEMSFCINGTKFMDVIYAQDGADIELELTDKCLKVESQTFKGKLEVAPIGNFPDLMNYEFNKFCEAKNIVEAMKAVKFTAGDKTGQKSLLGIAISGGFVYGTDGVRVSRNRLDALSSRSARVDGDFVDYLQNQPDSPDFLFHSGDNFIGALFSSSGTILITRCLTGAFPTREMDNLIEGSLGDYKVNFPEELLFALKRFDAVSGVGKELKLENIKEGLKITAGTPGIGEAVEVLPWSFQIPFSFKIDPSHLKQALRITEQADLTSVIVGKQNSITFYTDEFTHVIALRS